MARDLFRRRHTGARGPRRGAHAPGHVHRLHRQRAGCTTSSGRSSTTPSTRLANGYRHRDHRDAEEGRLLRGDGQRPRHPRGHPSAAGRLRRGGRLYAAARRRQVQQQELRLFRRPARRGRVRGQRPLRVGGGGRVPAITATTSSRFESDEDQKDRQDRLRPRRRAAWQRWATPASAARRSASSPTRACSRTPTSTATPCAAACASWPTSIKGVRFVFTDERAKDPRRAAAVEYCYEGGLADFVQIPQYRTRQTITDPITVRGPGATGTLRARGHPVYRFLHGEHLFLRQQCAHRLRAARTRSGFKARRHQGVQRLRPPRRRCSKEKDNNLSGDDFREGMTAVVYAGRARSRSSRARPKGRLGNTEVQVPSSRPSVLSSSRVYLDDLEASGGGHSASSKRRSRRRRVREAARKARDVARAEERSSRPRRWWASLSSCTGRKAGSRTSCSSSRAIPPAAAPSRAATGAFRPFCRCAASPCNAEKKRHGPGAGQRGIPIASSPRWARASARSSTYRTLKYNRVIILSDADQDGAHIRAILLDLLLPLYARVGYRRPRLHRYAAALQGRQEGREARSTAIDDNGAACEQSKRSAAATRVQRYKGLGRNESGAALGDDHEPQRPQADAGYASRTSTEAERRVTVLMGDKVEPRKAYISAYANFNKHGRFQAVSRKRTVRQGGATCRKRKIRPSVRPEEIVQKSMEDVMHDSMMPYSEHVILERALPARGGRPEARSAPHSLHHAANWAYTRQAAPQVRAHRRRLSR